jgi:hypothetical protein
MRIKLDEVNEATVGRWGACRERPRLRAVPAERQPSCRFGMHGAAGRVHAGSFFSRGGEFVSLGREQVATAGLTEFCCNARVSNDFRPPRIVIQRRPFIRSGQNGFYEQVASKGCHRVIVDRG